MKILNYFTILALSLFIAACSDSKQQTSSNQTDVLKIKYDKEYSDQEKSLISRVTDDVSKKICPNIFSNPEAIESIEAKISSPSAYIKESRPWTKQIEIEAKLAFNSDLFGSAAGNYCRFEVGQDGAYLKNKCAKEACKRMEEPAKEMLVTFLPENLDYIEKN